MSRSPVAFVTANTFEFDSRHRRATEALAADGRDVTVVAMAGPGLPAEEHWPSGVKVRRPPVDRRILSAVPRLLRGPASRLLDLPVDAERLPPAGGGPSGRSRAILRRGLEIAAFSRRIRPWADAAVEAAPAARIWVAKALVAIPVAADAASQTGGLYVYDIADLHIESGRLAALPGPLKSWLRRREAGWVHGAAGRLTVTPAMAAHIAELYDVPPPTVVLNVREPWRPDEPAPELATLHRAAGLAPERRVVLYQGAFRPDQGIELLLAALDAPPLRGRDVVAVFLGFGPLEDRLRRAALERPGRIVLLRRYRRRNSWRSLPAPTSPSLARPRRQSTRRSRRPTSYSRR